MIVSTLLLLAGVWAAASAAASLPRMVRPWDAVFLWFFLSWPLGEIPFFALAAEALTGAVLVGLGGLDHGRGVVGLVLLVASWPALVVLQRRAAATAGIVDAAIAEVYPDVAPREPFDKALLRRPFVGPGPGVSTVRGLSYGPRRKRNLLDVHTPEGGATGAPVIIQVHGGAWIVGSKDQQGFPLINHLVRRGWVAVSINYGLAPRVTIPDQVADVKAAVAWVREHIAEHGGDPSFIAITGGSAGGHLTAAAALDPTVTVQAAVPFYGMYDLLNSSGTRGRRGPTGMLARWGFKSDPVTDRASWEAASPLFGTHVDAPPFFVLHGTHDSLIRVEDTRHFVAKLRAVSRRPVAYAELPGAQHAFDMFNSVRALEAVEGVGRWLDRVRQTPEDSAAKDSLRQSA